MGCQTTVVLGNNLTFTVMTHDPDTGVLTDADAVPTYRVYEDETAAPILTGSMAKLDDANTVGFYSELIACTSGNGFEVGKSYNIYIIATVDSDQGGISFSFTVEAATPDVNLAQWLGVTPLTLTAQMVPANVLGWMSATPLGLSSQKVQTHALTVADKTGYGLAAGQEVQLNVQGKADVNAEADQALVDYDSPTDAEMDAGHAAIAALIAALNNLSAAQVNAEVDTALADYDGPTDTEMLAAFAALNNLSAAEVWAYGTRTLTSFGTLVADIWEHGGRTLTGFGTLVADIWAYATRALTDKASFTLTSAEHTNIADALLKRDWTAVAGEASRSVLNALRRLRNKWAITGAVLSVKKEDDAAEAWNATLSTTEDADPVTGFDPS